VNLFYEPLIKAKNGGHGMGKKMSGRSGADKIVKVPVGTVVWLEEKEERPTSNVERPTSNSEQLAIPVTDLARDGQEFVLCRGGAGGKGNVHFKSSRNRAPRQYTEGEEGEQGHFLLELRTIADAGLVGYPNAGKSTLLRKISAARPKVAAYPFTTLHPIVGVIEFPGYRRATVADIPGLIEGAHRGLGLGHEFLRHITRCRVLVFVVDTAGSEGRNPVEDLQNLRREIDLYDPTLSSRAWFVVANKMDLPGAKENLKALQERFPKLQILPTSAAKGEGIDDLKQALAARTADPEGSVSAAI
jgi:GTP-binding protein